WNKFLLSPIEMKKYVEEIGSEYVKVYFDVGNILVIGFPEMWIRILGRLIKRIHLKDFKLSIGNINGFCDLLEGDVNWPEVIKALKEIGYNSYLTAEVGPYKYFPETKIYNTSLAMDKILGRK
ncbi:MAG: sugar phosphate isomerase/epimerase family protein, partial [Candidatus Ratteibacteria bacterium]